MRMRMAAALAGVLGALGLAGAAQAVDGTLSEVSCPKGDVTIAVLGDSLADGIWGSFYRAFHKCPGVDVLRATAVSEGLAKSDPEQWVSRLDGTTPDLVVVSIGANDLVNIRADRLRFIYGQPDWETEYQARSQNLAAELKSMSGAVIWMGLPIVGRQEYESSYRRISQLQAAAAESAGIRFVDTHEPTTFGHGSFVMSAEVDGSVKQLRHTDMVHFTEFGYDLVAGLMRGAVLQTFERASRDESIGGVALQ